jgi:uncharacterized membrane protein YkvA (DUF1232 family)
MPGIIEKLKQKAKTIQQETIALYYAYRDPRTPWYARTFSALVVAYFFSPIDLIPDFIPVLGYLDDLVLVPLGISLAVKMIPPDVMADARSQAAKPVANKTASVILTVVILCAWGLILYFIGTSILRLITSKH